VQRGARDVLALELFEGKHERWAVGGER
jgi:hypothetical protein